MKVKDWILSKLEKRVISRKDGNPYLERYYLLHNNKFKYIPGIYIHKFLSSDEDPELHNHPWGASVSLILKGSYTEERRNKNDSVSFLKYKPGNINLIFSNTFHRIELDTDYVWTLFFSGQRKQEWGFWNQKTKNYVHWKEHVNE